MTFLSLKKFVSLEEQEVCGIDEVGRGPWAGPLVACALMFHKKFHFKGLRDSKQLTESQRESAYEALQSSAFYGVGIVEVEEIDALGIIKATNLSFIRSLQKMPFKPTYLLVDGRDKLQLPYPFTSIIKGDEKIKLIACASIIAKVVRDRMMVEYSKQYPAYGFHEHKGYGTRKHQDALSKNGICKIHRKSFKPIKNLVASYS